MWQMMELGLHYNDYMYRFYFEQQVYHTSQIPEFAGGWLFILDSTSLFLLHEMRHGRLTVYVACHPLLHE